MFNILGTACFMKVELSAPRSANNGVGDAAGDSTSEENRRDSGSQHSDDALLD